MRALPPWIGWAGLALVMLLEAVLVVKAANPSPHSGGDNAGYVALAYSLLDRHAYVELWEPGEPAHTKYPPGFPLLLAGMIALGARTWTALKASSAVFTVLAVGLAYLWAWRRRSWWMGLGVAFVLAWSDSFVYSSQWVLSDPLFLVLTLAGLTAFEPPRRETAGGLDPGPGGEGADPPEGPSGRWMALGVVASILAYFTRSAGLPLVAAIALWLAWGRRWRALGAFAAAFAVPAALWMVRSAVAGAPGYVSEFWMVNPYDPSLGRAGVGDLLTRIIENTKLYFGSAIPAGLVGRRGPTTTLLGGVLTLLALAGWGRRVRRPGVAELFAPLYLGLILLWPVVWSGDRFALPLFALVLFYAAELLSDGARRLNEYAPLLVGALAVFLLWVPAQQAWRTYVAQAELCRDRVAEGGAYGCYQPRMREFVTAARWASVGLPEGSVVLTRKPRIFYVLSEIKSRTYPLVESADTLLAAADAAGARYALIDYLDNLGGLYMIPSVHQRPGAFCALVGFGGDQQGIQTQLLGVQPVERRGRPGTVQTQEGVTNLTVRLCPADYRRPDAPTVPPHSSLEIPLLSRLDR
ncbi:MAG: hypothetical protein R3E10_05795 [Gemmatimonadota bacterium]